jgi:hypothetical protein
MQTITKILATGAGLAALAGATPALAQYYPYGVAQPYAYGSPYGAPYGNAYGYQASATQLAAQRCTAAVQARLNSRPTMTGILGAVLGIRAASTSRVLSVTQVNPKASTIRVRGLATSGQYAGYNPYGIGAYGAAGYAYQPDLSFKCDVDYRGYVRDVDINRRR